jgi:DNA-binding LacI/PurR family transcriptional regulator
MAGKTLLTPKFVVAQRRILQWIRSGEHRAGDRLPGEQELATRLGINHRTVRRGLEELVKAGVIEKRPRVGNFVKQVRPRELTISLALVYPQYLLDQSAQHPTVGALIGGACQSMDHRDYSATTMSYRPGRLWDDVGPVLVERGVRGILLYPQRDLTVAELLRLEEAGVHVVLTGPTRDQRVVDIVSGAVWVGAPQTLENLLNRIVELKHRRLAVALYTEGPNRRRFEIILSTLARQHPELGGLEQIVFEMPNRQAPDFSRLSRLLDRDPLPTAIVVPDEVCAAEVFRICHRRSIRIPEQISLASLDNNTPLAFPIALASPDSLRHLSEVGRCATEMLISLVEGRSPERRVVEIQPQLRLGESLGPSPLDSPSSSASRQ